MVMPSGEYGAAISVWSPLRYDRQPTSARSNSRYIAVLRFQQRGKPQ